MAISHSEAPTSLWFVTGFWPVFAIILLMLLVSIVPAYLLLKRNAFEPSNWGSR